MQMLSLLSGNGPAAVLYDDRHVSSGSGRVAVRHQIRRWLDDR